MGNAESRLSFRTTVFQLYENKVNAALAFFPFSFFFYCVHVLKSHDRSRDF